MRFLNTDIIPGTKIKTSLPINGGASTPVWIISGKTEGKTLIITTGVHGCEYVGIETVRRLWNEVQPENIKGTLVILPLINASGFYGGLKQIMAEDGKNLNRMFPGSEDGTFSRQTAYALEKHIYPLGDFLIDLHGGDINESLTPLVFFPVSDRVDESVRQAALEGAKHLMVPYRVRSTASNGLYSWANLRGLPSVLQEIGCLGRWSESEVGLCKDSIYSLMGHLGMGCQAKINAEQRESRAAYYLESSCDGYWYPCAEADKPVKKGEKLGHTEDIDGSILEEFYSVCDGVVWYYTTALGVSKGDALVAYGSME